MKGTQFLHGLQMLGPPLWDVRAQRGQSPFHHVNSRRFARVMLGPCATPHFSDQWPTNLSLFRQHLGKDVEVFFD